MNELSLLYHRVPLSSDHDAHESQIQCLSAWIILDKSNSYPLIFTFQGSKQVVLYSTIQLIGLVKSHFSHMSLKL